MSLELL